MSVVIENMNAVGEAVPDPPDRPSAKAPHSDSRISAEGFLLEGFLPSSLCKWPFSLPWVMCVIKLPEGMLWSSLFSKL